MRRGGDRVSGDWKESEVGELVSYCSAEKDKESDERIEKPACLFYFGVVLLCRKR